MPKSRISPIYLFLALCCAYSCNNSKLNGNGQKGKSASSDSSGDSNNDDPAIEVGKETLGEIAARADIQTPVEVEAEAQIGTNTEIPSSQPSPSISPVPLPTSQKRVSTLAVALANKGLDIVWVVDGSLSMGSKMPQVTTNLLQFNKSISKVKEIRMAVLSRTAGNNAIPIDPTTIGVGNIQISVSVGDSDGPAIAAAASCKVSPPVDDTVCGQLVSADGNAADAAGALLKFFRPGATRAYVFVSDDNPRGVDDSNFLKLVQSEDPKLKPIVFAFHGIANQPGCNIDPGLVYDALAKATGGKTYDICLPDWTNSMKDIAARGESIAILTYELAATVLKVEAVKVDGVLVPETAYKVEGRRLVFARGVLTSKSLKIEVTAEESFATPSPTPLPTPTPSNSPSALQLH